MKIYIISDDAKYRVTAANTINMSGNMGIMSVSSTDDVRDLLSEAKENIDSYDLILLICHGARDVSISANKLAGIRAVSCKDEDDATGAASETRANLILVDSIKLTQKQLGDILNGLINGINTGSIGPARVAQQAPQRQAQNMPEAQQKKASFSQIKAKLPKVNTNPKPKPEIEEPVQDANEQNQNQNSMINSIKKKGFMKSLKEALGVDEQ
ncbi:MAG: RpiB/LacA/LacB family sugar-phosphate isomerase [Candidatus Marsarchaeota archaeon]|nr:RpiB/LacA/LacB family sugar-phosphate isomerase [Candidatus Marsarchaeota archaeon]